MMSERIISEARSWIGTPYAHQHLTKHAGCDCLGLVRGVYINVIGPEPEVPPSYSPSWGEGGRKEVLLEAAARHLTEIPMDDMRPGDVLVFRMSPKAIAKHCGILVSEDRMIHSYVRSGVIEGYLVDYWYDKIVGVFRFPEVE